MGSGVGVGRIMDEVGVEMGFEDGVTGGVGVGVGDGELEDGVIGGVGVGVAIWAEEILGLIIIRLDIAKTRIISKVKLFFIPV